MRVIAAKTNCSDTFAMQFVDKTSTRTPNQPKRVVMLTFDGASSLDTIGPVDVLAGAKMALQAPDPVYQVEMFSLGGGLVSTSPAQLKIDTLALGDLNNGPIDILMISGGESAVEIYQTPEMCSAVRMLSQRANCVASICTGAFILASAGLLKKPQSHNPLVLV
ncbi:DJ-1/PfpI family protein [Aestuariibius sp. HNIBRBA575]|uniref:DJ-1/PfpI family protein n=1 Tax=Aestuariibius sp. HNIBRBA575 TaxID=3233343 RepID=UPI0034A1F1AE